MTNTTLLTVKYQPANTKLQALADHLEALWGRKPKIYGVSLPAGHSCPGADICKSSADRITGKITDGPNTQVRCFMASIESYSKQSRAAGWENFDILRAHKDSPALMAESLRPPADADVVRFGVNGDFFNQKHFDAALIVARENPHIMFYAYTKSVNYWVNRLGQIPANLNLNASRGGRYDHLIDEHNLKSAVIVYHPEEADALGLEIDHDETHALLGRDSFALLIHGTQPKGSPAAAALKRLKTENIKYAYSRREPRPATVSESLLAIAAAEGAAAYSS